MFAETRIRAGAALTAVLLLTAAYSRTHSATVMTEAAQTFLAALTPEQSQKAQFPFASDERLDWHFIPKPRNGLPLREMTPAQRHLANALLSAGLSQRGYIKAASIMSLEDVLRVLEKDDGERRNPEKYYFSIFGDPSPKGIWGFRIEGHHLSLNYTLANGRVVATPAFMGSNPAEVRQGSRKGLRVLGAEEDLGRELYVALTSEQRKVALVAQEAYKDIITGPARKAVMDGQPLGLPASKLNQRQKAMLRSIVEEYIYNLPDHPAEARLALLQRAGDNLHFAWAGVAERGGPHYYRVQSPDFLIEYDNTQNDSNHIHSVWREFKGDWGNDLLAEHYKASHK